ncbi:MAG: hypothetical protein IJY72_09090 [Akkermansia sp.]|nr:hypothetical protein [Akkermansia sp.]
MNKSIKALALALVMLPSLAVAYPKADTFEQAKTKIKDDGLVVVFVHADGWDKRSKKTVDRMMKDADVSKAMKDDVFMKLALQNTWS